jgi:hypothetical protein
MVALDVQVLEYLLRGILELSLLPPTNLSLTFLLGARLALEFLLDASLPQHLISASGIQITGRTTGVGPKCVIKNHFVECRRRRRPVVVSRHDTDHIGQDCPHHVGTIHIGYRQVLTDIGQKSIVTCHQGQMDLCCK